MSMKPRPCFHQFRLSTELLVLGMSQLPIFLRQLGLAATPVTIEERVSKWVYHRGRTDNGAKRTQTTQKQQQQHQEKQTMNTTSGITSMLCSRHFWEGRTVHGHFQHGQWQDRRRPNIGHPIHRWRGLHRRQCENTDPRTVCHPAESLEGHRRHSSSAIASCCSRV